MSVWNLLKEMDNLQSQLGELSRVGGFGNWPKMAFLPGISARHFPLMNMSSDEENVYVEALAPGLATETLKVSAVRDKLTISGEKARTKIPEDKFHRNERAVGKFTRTIELQNPIDPAKVSAEYKLGLLKVTLPKTEEAKPRQIEIKLD